MDSTPANFVRQSYWTPIKKQETINNGTWKRKWHTQQQQEQTKKRSESAAASHHFLLRVLDPLAVTHLNYSCIKQQQPKKKKPLSDLQTAQKGLRQSKAHAFVTVEEVAVYFKGI